MSRAAMRLRALTQPKVKPIGGLLDRDPVTGANRFTYIPAASTCVRTTIERVKREFAEGRRKL